MTTTNTEEAQHERSLATWLGDDGWWQDHKPYVMTRFGRREFLLIKESPDRIDIQTTHEPVPVGFDYPDISRFDDDPRPIYEGDNGMMCWGYGPPPQRELFYRDGTTPEEIQEMNDSGFKEGFGYPSKIADILHWELEADGRLKPLKYLHARMEEQK